MNSGVKYVLQKTKKIPLRYIFGVVAVLFLLQTCVFTRDSVKYSRRERELMDRIVQLESDNKLEVDKSAEYVRELQQNIGELERNNKKLEADNVQLRASNKKITTDFNRTRELTERIYQNETRARTKAKEEK